MTLIIRIARLIQRHARFVLVLLCLFLAASCWWSLRLQIDASADTLLDPHDQDYALSQAIDQRYHLTPSLVMVFRPKNGLFTPQGLEQIAQLERDLLAVKGVVTTTTILDAPLFAQSNVVHPSVGSDITLLTPGVNIPLARHELTSSPLYHNLFISQDGTTIGVDIQVEAPYLSDYKARKVLVHHLRNVVDHYRHDGDAYLGGLDVVADDMISYVTRDLLLFGTLVLICIAGILMVVFRRLKWVLLTIGICLAALVVMTGILGLAGWKVTIVSSNFVSLQIIFTMDLVIHLIMRYEELLERYPEESNHEVIIRTLRDKFSPSFYVSFTTVTGFASLLTSGIVPVISFGWMMIFGVSASFVLTFLIFIAVLSLLPPSSGNSRSIKSLPIREIARYITYYRGRILFVGGLLLILGIVGIFKLEVENSFINYFKKSTDLRQGLEFIDHHLGGTTPLTITIDAHTPARTSSPLATTSVQDAVFDDFKEVASADRSHSQSLTLDQVMMAKKVHEYLESQPAVGKVTSIWTTVKMAEIITKGPVGNFELAVLQHTLPPSLKTTLIDPYYSQEAGELRVALRLLDSDPRLNRNRFLQKVSYDLEHQLGLSQDQFHLSGAMVLYNKILQSLFRSQILTLGTSVLVLLVILIIWLRNFSLSMIIMVPNIFSVTSVLGFMGWFHIPLDMMTITIASITVGVAVDNAIHYVYHYRSEFLIDGDKVGALFRTHRSVGHAMTFSTLTICFGFGVLIFSNFIPNIMFGLLTIVAMIVALLSNLTIMPLCFLLFNPIQLPSSQRSYYTSP